MRLDRFVPTSIVPVTFLLVTSMTETPPSRECADQTSRPSGDTSMPSGPFPTGIIVCFQAPSGPCSISEMLSDAMFDVRMIFASLAMSTMCVPS